MKKIAIALGIFSLSVLPAFAADSSDGCGLGWQITSKTSFFATTTRGTTNYFVPPTFGMTSGTMGCAQHSLAKKDEAAAVYAMTNYDVLSVEMAQGQGEYLEGFARTLGCGDSAAASFGQMTQQHYKTIINSKNTSAVDMFKNVKNQIKHDPVLSAQCSA